MTWQQQNSKASTAAAEDWCAAASEWPSECDKCRAQGDFAIWRGLVEEWRSLNGPQVLYSGQELALSRYRVEQALRDHVNPPMIDHCARWSAEEARSNCAALQPRQLPLPMRMGIFQSNPNEPLYNAKEAVERGYAEPMAATIVAAFSADKYGKNDGPRTVNQIMMGAVSALAEEVL